MFEDPDVNIEKLAAEKISPNYVQHVDGKTLDYEQFIKHRLVQNKVVKTITVNFQHIVAEGDKIFTIHVADVEKKDGSKVKIKVIAMFIIKDAKLVACDELTHVLEGSKEDEDLGSRH